ncbi:signal peptidase II [Cohnella panacarvi]|uniref:signal peptidase II n=1 Tax=Cohnella panacarvi TaxID=400776 RepID=UPI00047BF52F|nr:signal peptidase II [Cohnella panacarvi]
MYFYIIILLSLAVDLATKIAVRANMALGEKTELWGIVKLSHLANTGSSGNMLHGMGRLLAVVVLIIVGVAFYLRGRGKFPGMLSQVGLALFIGGALGNVYDRIVYNQVTDFLYFGDSATMNFADIWVFIGIITIVIGNFIDKKRRTAA